MADSFSFDSSSEVALGAIGEPGNRVFIMQIREGTQSLTVKLEKTQVAGLVQYIAMMLGDLDRLGHLPEAALVRPPIEPSFAVGEIGVEYHEDDDIVVVELTELAEEVPDRAKVVLRITKELAGTLAIQGTGLIEAGRPTCPLCGFPIEPEGHPCPRTNGYRAPTP